MALKIEQGFQYLDNDYWKWWIWLEGPDAELDKVEKVTYTLHRTFPKPVRVISDRGTKFKLETAGWGVFRIFAQVQMKDGASRRMQHDLVLSYPDGTPTTT